MAIFYPRKQTVIIFLVCIIAVGGTLAYVDSQTSQAQTDNAQNPVAIIPTTDDSMASASTSADWRTAFFGASSTSPYKPAASAGSAQTEPLTATDKLGRDFFTKYMQLHQAGLDTDPTTVDNTVSQLVTASIASIQPPKTYAVSDIQVSAAFTPQTLQSYSKAILQILNAYVPATQGNEAVIAGQALSNGDMSLLKGIDPVIAGYQAAIRTLLGMSVPQPIAQYHIQMLDGFSIELSNAKALRKADVDPVQAMSAIELESTGIQAMDDALTGMKQYFTTAGIPFGQ